VSARALFAVVVAVSLASVSLGCGTEPSPVVPVHGITFVDWSPGGYATPAADASLTALAATGATDVAILVTTYQASPTADVPRVDDPRTPTPDAVAAACARAEALGLEVTLKLHVDLDDGAWRATIDPRDPKAWFAAYDAFVLAWAKGAEACGASRLVLGTELAGTLHDETQWRELVARVRTVFGGELTYAASWDEADLVPFWDALDRVGVDAYQPVAGETRHGRLDVLAAWQPWLDRMHRLARRTGRPVLLSELGYRSVEGAGRRPWASEGGVRDDATQADLYWAALEAMRTPRWLGGVLVWDWPAVPDPALDPTGYTPRDKPAETVLSEAWAR